MREISAANDEEVLQGSHKRRKKNCKKIETYKKIRKKMNN